MYRREFHEEPRGLPHLADLTLGYLKARTNAEIDMTKEWLTVWETELHAFLSTVDPRADALALERRTREVEDSLSKTVVQPGSLEAHVLGHNDVSRRRTIADDARGSIFEVIRPLIADAGTPVQGR